MEKNTKILASLAILSCGAITSVMLLGQRKSTTKINAVGCLHSHVEHYDGFVNDGTGQIEHWACCECHTAWADENKTIALGETTNDRSKIDFSSLCTYQAMGTTDWSVKPAEPVYDVTYGAVFRNYLVDLGSGKQNEVATIQSGFTLEEKGYKNFTGRLTNCTNQTLNITLFDRAWSKSFKDFSLAAGESYSFLVSADDWKNSKSGDNYGFAFLITNTAQLSEGSYVELTKPTFLTDDPALSWSGLFSNIQSTVDDWRNFSTVYDYDKGYVLQDNVSASTVFYIIGRTTLDEDKYIGVTMKVYNGTNTNTNSGQIWNEDWIKHYSRPAFVANSWTEVFIPIDVWNGGNTMIGFYDMSNAAGLYKFGDFELNEKGAPYVCFGDADNETFTAEFINKTWASSTKFVDQEKGKAFRIDYTGKDCFATNNKSQVNADSYEIVEFYVYNGCDKDFTMYSTSDWAVNTDYGTLVKDTWTYCSMTVAEFNKGTTYFYPSGTLSGEILVTYFVAK